MGRQLVLTAHRWAPQRFETLAETSLEEQCLWRTRSMPLTKLVVTIWLPKPRKIVDTPPTAITCAATSMTTQCTQWSHDALLGDNSRAATLCLAGVAGRPLLQHHPQLKLRNSSG